MPIETLCQTCNNRLRVADEHAGKLARCPKCQSVYTVPTPQTASSAGANVGLLDQWRLKTADGNVYGPVPRADIDRWLTEGRVTPDSQLLQAGTDNWRSAREVYPQLASAGFAAAAAPANSTLSSSYAPAGSAFASEYGGSASTQPSGGNPFATTNPFSDRSVQPNPYAGTIHGGVPNNFGRYYKPHRGVMILVLGILGLTVCGLLGLPAAFMGLTDLREMNAGRMDPSGKGLTIAGMVMGWVCVGLFALGVLIALFAVIAS